MVSMVCAFHCLPDGRDGVCILSWVSILFWVVYLALFHLPDSRWCVHFTAYLMVILGYCQYSSLSYAVVDIYGSSHAVLGSDCGCGRDGVCISLPT